MPRATRPLNSPTVAEYLKGIAAALPENAVRESVMKFSIGSLAEAIPDADESLFSWLQRPTKRKLRLTLIVGETGTDHRVTRKEAPHSEPARTMTMARPISTRTRR